MLGSYRIERPLGRGGMSMVYRGRHTAIGRPVAVKVLDPHFGTRRSMSQRGLREAQLLSRVRHDNVVSVLDFGTTEDGLAYLVMEYVPGRTLQQRLEASGPLAWSSALDLVRQLLQGLRAIHSEHIVHRDVKPDNCILLPKPELIRLKLIDFGVAKSVASPGPRITQADTTIGTPCYMSPEQIRGDIVDARADLYAVGIVLFELLVGYPPFVAGSSAEVLVRQLRDRVPDLFEESPASDAPRGVTAVIRRATAKRPADRFADASAMLRALDALARPHSRASRTHRRARPLTRGDAGGLDLQLGALDLPGPSGPLRIVREQGRRIAALVTAGALSAAFAVVGPELLAPTRSLAASIEPLRARVLATVTATAAATTTAANENTPPPKPVRALDATQTEPRIHRPPPLLEPSVHEPAVARRGAD